MTNHPNQATTANGDIASNGASALWRAVHAALTPASIVYGCVMDRRNRRYDAGLGVHAPALPVLSVGNLTTGGTGKTPLVIDIVQRLRDRKLRVAVVSRGYKADAGELGDELTLIQRRCPDAVCVANADRVAAVSDLAGRDLADVVVLDDAFQHRRIGRDLDMVTIDATQPFGFGHLLPRGRLREPLSSLSRADVVVLTRVNCVDEATVEAIERRIRNVSADTPVLRSTHAHDGWAMLDGKPAVGRPQSGQSVVCLSGIGNPRAFEQTVVHAGLQVAQHLALADHAKYGPGELRVLDDAVSRHQPAFVVTTEKDAVKLSHTTLDLACPVVALSVSVRFEGDGGMVFDETMGAALHRANERLLSG